MANRIQLRRGGAQEWANANPTLAQGELGIELDTGRIKIGDGVSGWNNLRYERPIESTSNTAETLVQRDADGNFQAGTITATLIGNASTASRFASTRQIQLANEGSNVSDVLGSDTFDGSENVVIVATLRALSTLPHYDGTTTSSDTYTRVVVDAKGRVINATRPNEMTLAAYGLDGNNPAVGQTNTDLAQPWDADLQALANNNENGIVIRRQAGTVAIRDIQGTSGEINVTNGSGVNGDPTLNLINTTVIPDPVTYAEGLYNTESLTSVNAVGANGEPFGTETVNAVKFTVDRKGRLQSATNVPIATAREGSKYPNYNAGTAYVRYDIIQNASKVYQALTSISAGAGAPTHSSGDSGGWRYLAAEATEQKGLASFAQEDFDVDSNGHVTIAAAGVDNTQLQNNRLIFTDRNSVQEFELDNELTATDAHDGFDYLNYIKINDTSGNLLFGANNTGDSGAGEIDVNVRSYFSDPDITLDGAVAQTLDKTGDGNLTFQLTQNSSSARNLSILSTNAGSGTSTVTITAEDVVDIDASDANGKVHVENARFQANYIATTDATMHLDPGDDRAVTGLVRVWGDLQVDGTTTTVNSTVMTVDDPIITLGGDTAPASDDNKDRGVEFRYYDSQARVGFYGWDTNYTDLGGHEGGYRFLHAATNTSEVFAGTDSGIIAGNLKLTTNTNSTSNTTGDLVVAGGAGIGDDVNIGGSVDIDTNLTVHGTTLHDDNIVIQGASKVLQLNNGSGTQRIQLQSTTGNASFHGVVDITNNLNINTNKFNVASATGNTLIAGTLGVTGVTTITGATDLNSTLNVAAAVHFESTDEPTWAKNGSTGLWEIQSNDYGAFRFDGGGYIAGDFMFDSDVVINGTILQRDDTTETFNEQNFLRVRRKFESGSTSALTPNFALHNQSNARIFGGAGVGTDLHVGEDFFVGKKNSGDSVKFEVLGATGNTTIEGTLLVEGNVNFNGTLDVDADFAVRNGTTDKFFVDNVTGNTDIQGTLDVNGATEITNTLDVSNAVTFDQTLLVQGNSEFNGTVDIDANFAVRSGTNDKFTVNSSNGNTQIDGTLTVDGETRINDTLRLRSNNEAFIVENGSGVDKFTVDSDNGNTNIIGTLTVGDATQINDTFGVSGVTTLTANSQQTLTGNYGADGAFRLTGGAGVGKNLAVGEGLRVYGATELTGALDLNNSADISGALVAHDNVTINANNKMFKIQTNSAVDKFTVDTDNGNTDIRGTLDVGGDLTAESNLTVTGNLVVNGTTTTVNSTVTTIDDPIITLGGDTAPASNDAKDRGVEFRYYDSTAKTGFFGLDRSSLEYVFLTTTTNSSEVVSGTDGDLRAGSLHLTGAGTTLDVDADANVDGTLTVDGQIRSQVTSGPALVIPTTNKINNLNADLLDSMTTATNATASTIVNRDSAGNFAANIITVASGTGLGAGIQGNARTADTLKTARTITIDGVVDGSVSFNGSADVTISTTYNDADITALAAMAGTGFVSRTAANTYAQRTLQVTASSGITLTNADGVSGNPTINVASASTNASNNLVLRDGSGNFAANVITADLVGDVTGDLTGNADSATRVGVALPALGGAQNFRVALAETPGGPTSIITDAGIFYNYVTNTLTVSGSVAANVTGNLTGSASQVDTVTASSADATYYLTMVDQHNASANNETINTDQSLTYNPSNNRLSTKLQLQTDAAPSSATDTGVTGEIRYDANYVYVCVATDTWKRSALSTW